MDRACLLAAFYCASKDSLTTHCAVARCHQKYCDNNECTDDEKRKGSEEGSWADGIGCPADPCPKKRSSRSNSGFQVAS